MQLEKKVLIFGGQGNVTGSCLRKIANQPEAVVLLKEIKEVDIVAYNTINDVITKGERLEIVYHSLLATFFYNEYYVKTLVSREHIHFASSHSAGIFNLALFSGEIDLKAVLTLIKQRADLLTNYEFEENMYYFICDDFPQLEKVIAETPKLDVCLSIITDEMSGVIAGKDQEIHHLKILLNDQGVNLVLKKSTITVPYHSTYLSFLKSEYEKILVSAHLNGQESDQQLTLIFEKNHGLEAEILAQLTDVFHWKTIKEKLIDLKVTDVYDSSPNKFISKQLKKMKLDANYH